MFYQKKKKRGRVVLAICVLLLLAGFTYGYMSNKQPQEKPHNIAELQGSENLVANNPVEAEANRKNVDEGEQETDVANQEGDTDIIDKVNEGTEIVLSTHYSRTGEMDTRKIKIPITLIGATLNDFKSYVEGNYREWQVTSISTQTASLYKKVDGYKPNNFILQSKDGYIVIYKINESGEKVLHEETGISLSLLSETDKKKLDEGITVKSKEEVYNILEDYSS